MSGVAERVGRSGSGVGGMKLIRPMRKVAEVVSVMAATVVLLRVFGKHFGVSMNPDGLAAQLSWPAMLFAVVIRGFLQKKEFAAPQGRALDA